MGELLSQLPNKEKIEYPLTNYKNFSQAYTALGASSQISINIPAKYASLKSYLIGQRTSTGAATFFPYSSIVNGVASYQFKIGPNTVPSSAPSKYPEMFAEVIKAVGSLNDLTFNPNIDLTSYTLNTNAALGDAFFNKAQSGSFYIGIDLENFPNADKSSIFAGMNTTTDDTQLMVTYSATVANTAVRFDIFTVYDGVIVCNSNKCNRCSMYISP
jgi:hypothetical protein